MILSEVPLSGPLVDINLNRPTNWNTVDPLAALHQRLFNTWLLSHAVLPAYVKPISSTFGDLVTHEPLAMMGAAVV